MSLRNTARSRAFMELTVVQKILSKAKETDVDKSRHNQAAQPDPETMLSNPEAFAAYIRSEKAKWEKVVKAAKLYHTN